jgi:hypothetical protein
MSSGGVNVSHNAADEKSVAVACENAAIAFIRRIVQTYKRPLVHDVVTLTAAKHTFNLAVSGICDSAVILC